MTTLRGQVTITRDGETIQTIDLDKAMLRIGRLPDNDIHLEDPAVSRYHGELREEDGAIVIVDLDSANGTFIGNQRLAANRPWQLQSGERFRIGPFVLTYNDLPATQPEQSAPMSIEETRSMTAAMTISGSNVGQAPLSQTVRPSQPPLDDAPDRPSHYLKDLPACFQTSENEFLGRYLRIFEAIWEPLEQRQDYIHMYFDPRTCPPVFVRWIAGWLDFDLNPNWSDEQCRWLVYRAVELHRHSGTSRRLAAVIKLWTGLDATIENLPGFVFRVQVTIPPDREADLQRQLIEELIYAHKPAPCGFILELTQQVRN